MSVAQLKSELASFDGAELRALEEALHREKQRRGERDFQTAQARLFEIINEPLPGADELPTLRQGRDQQTLSADQHARLVGLENEVEVVWARKLRAVAELADLRGEEFETLYRSLELNLRQGL